MTSAAVDAAIPAGATVLLDTSAVLAYLSGAEPASATAATIIDDFVATGRNRALVSAITVTEALVRPMRASSPTAVRLVDDFLLHFPNLVIEPVTVAIAREAARIRALTAAPTPDALILATAVLAPAAIVVGNDVSWPKLAKRAGLGLRVFVLESLDQSSSPTS
jgi:predicted nucleic acid-binding protein